jgi:hypothetical protein
MSKISFLSHLNFTSDVRNQIYEGLFNPNLPKPPLGGKEVKPKKFDPDATQPVPNVKPFDPEITQPITPLPQATAAPASKPAAMPSGDTAPPPVAPPPQTISPVATDSTLEPPFPQALPKEPKISKGGVKLAHTVSLKTANQAATETDVAGEEIKMWKEREKEVVKKGKDIRQAYTKHAREKERKRVSNEKENAYAAREKEKQVGKAYKVQAASEKAGGSEAEQAAYTAGEEAKKAKWEKGAASRQERRTKERAGQENRAWTEKERSEKAQEKVGQQKEKAWKVSSGQAEKEKAKTTKAAYGQQVGQEKAGEAVAGEYRDYVKGQQTQTAKDQLRAKQLTIRDLQRQAHSLRQEKARRRSNVRTFNKEWKGLGTLAKVVGGGAARIVRSMSKTY